jgi:hypothetical protein
MERLLKFMGYPGNPTPHFNPGGSKSIRSKIQFIFLCPSILVLTTVLVIFRVPLVYSDIIRTEV